MHTSDQQKASQGTVRTHALRDVRSAPGGRASVARGGNQVGAGGGQPPCCNTGVRSGEQTHQDTPQEDRHQVQDEAQARAVARQLAREGRLSAVLVWTDQRGERRAFTVRQVRAWSQRDFTAWGAR